MQDLIEGSETERGRSPPDRGPSSEERLALRLSDDQLDEVMRLCQPLAPHCRDALLRILAHRLRGRRDVKGRKPMQTGVVNGWRCRYDLQTGKFDVPALFSGDNAKALVPE